jgi:transcriptional regulator with XRE-family HTH domain
MSQVHSTEALTFDLHDRLHKSLRVSGHSSKTLGDAIGVHRNTVSNYLSGRTAVDRRTLIAWAFATGVPVEWLEHGTSTDPGPGVTGRNPVSLRLAA